MADIQKFADWLYDNGHLESDPDTLVKKYRSQTQSDHVHPSGEPYCYIPNCRNAATKQSMFCKVHGDNKCTHPSTTSAGGVITCSKCGEIICPW